MEKMISREAALALLRQYNQEPFHIQHALTVEAVMRWFANDLGYGEEADFWAMCGLLHDIDFEKWPEQHCVKAPELLRPAGVGEEMIHAICSHGHKICTDVAPEKEMEKVLFACDELTGLIGAAALMRPLFFICFRLNADNTISWQANSFSSSATTYSTSAPFFSLRTASHTGLPYTNE